MPIWTAFCDSTSTRMYNAKLQRKNGISDCYLRPIVMQKRRNADQYDCGVT